MVGSALVRRLVAENVELVTASRSGADLRDQAAVNAWFAANHVGAVTSPLQIGITAYGIPPDGVPSRDSYPVGTRERRLFDLSRVIGSWLSALRDQRSVLYVPVTMGSIESRWLNFKVSAFLTRAGVPSSWAATPPPQGLAASIKICTVFLEQTAVSSGEAAARFVADTQQHSPKSTSMAPQPYAAAIASLMVAHGLGQMDWDFQ
jgi:hypothetical protein